MTNNLNIWDIYLKVKGDKLKIKLNNCQLFNNYKDKNKWDMIINNLIRWVIMIIIAKNNWKYT